MTQVSTPTHFLPQDTSPRELGFAMPAEWHPHVATWMSYPADDELWFGHLDDVRDEYLALVQTIARFERVELLVRDEESAEDFRHRLARSARSNEPSASDKNGQNDNQNTQHSTAISLHHVPLDDVWIRDNGPLFVCRNCHNNTAQVSLLNFQFNAWGGKFDWTHDNQVPEYIAQHLQMAHWDLPHIFEGGALEVNGAGVALTTRSCLLTPTRNSGMDEKAYQTLLKDYLGIDKLLWLEGGLENDHTDGHIDTITRFVNETTIVTSVEPNTDDPNHAVMSKNRAELSKMTDIHGRPFQIVDLPLPSRRLEGAEGRLPPTYANFYIGNGFVVVPQYDDPHDQTALDVLTPLFPAHQVIGLRSRSIIEGGGSFHCMTQQQPAGTVWTG